MTRLRNRLTRGASLAGCFSVPVVCLPRALQAVADLERDGSLDVDGGRLRLAWGRGSPDTGHSSGW